MKDDEKILKNRRLFCKRVFLLVMIILIMCMAFGVVFFVSEYQKEQKFVTLLAQDNYTEATNYFFDVLEKNDKQKQKADELVKEKIDIIITQYYNCEMDYTEAKEQIHVYSEMFPEDVYLGEEQIQTLYESRNAYLSAEEMYRAENYKDAMTFYACVIEADENYLDAQEKYVECYHFRLEDLIKRANGLAAENKYDEAIALLCEEDSFLWQEDKLTIATLKIKYENEKRSYEIEMMLKDNTW